MTCQFLFLYFSSGLVDLKSQTPDMVIKSSYFRESRVKIPVTGYFVVLFTCLFPLYSDQFLKRVHKKTGKIILMFDEVYFVLWFYFSPTLKHEKADYLIMTGGSPQC